MADPSAGAAGRVGAEAGGGGGTAAEGAAAEPEAPGAGFFSVLLNSAILS